MRPPARLLIFPGLVLVTVLPLLVSEPAEATLGGWSHSFDLSVTNPNAALSGYPVQAVVDTRSLIADGKMRGDCGDLRVTTTNEGVLLGHWIESGCGTTATRVWIRTDLPAGASVLRIHHGNPGASSQSSIASTFTAVPSFTDFAQGWRQSPAVGGASRAWDPELTTFALDTTGWSTVTISADNVNTDRSRWYVRKEFFLTGGSYSFSGDVDDDFVFTLVRAAGGFLPIGGDVYDADGGATGPFTHGFSATAGRYVWAGRGYEGSGEDYLRITSASPLSGFYTRPVAATEPIVEAAGTGAFARTVTLASSVGTLTDHQALVTLDTAPLVAQGKLRGDCANLGFRDPTTGRALAYWLESGCNTAATRLWVRVPSISASTNVLLEYGAPPGLPSDGRGAFLLFDDFEDGATTGWNLVRESQTFSESGGRLRFPATASPGTMAFGSFAAGPLVVEWSGDAEGTGFNNRVPSWEMHTSTAGPVDQQGTLPARHVALQPYTSGTAPLVAISGYSMSTTQNSASYPATPSIFTLEYTGSALRGYAAGTLRFQGGVTLLAPILPSLFSEGSGATNEAPLWWDDFRVRRFASAAPGVTIGAETGGQGWRFYDFESGTAGPDWSRSTITTSPSGNKFSGKFANEEQVLTMPSLPAHSQASLQLDLHTIDTWDGSGTANGPDIVDISVDGVGTQLHATFTKSPNTGAQSYPAAYPGPDNAPETGAASTGTLGYTGYGDAMYRLSYTFPHSASSLVVRIKGQNLQGTGDESWGIDNVLVTLPGVSVAPQIQMSFSGSIGENGWYSSNGSLQLSCTQTCGSISYRVDDGAWTSYTGAFPLTGPATRIVQAYASGAFPGPINSTTFRIDPTPPPAPLIILGGIQGASGQFRSNVTASATAADVGSGVGEYRCGFDGAILVPVASLAPETADGPHTVTCMARDLAGNSGPEATLAFTIDRSPPTSTATIAPEPEGERGWRYTVGLATLDASDSGSGVDRIEFRVDEGVWQTYNRQPGPVPGIILAAEKNTTLGYRAIDRAGNVEPERTVAVPIDQTPPTAAVRIDPSMPTGTAGWWKAPAPSILVDASDRTSGVAERFVRLDDGPEQAWTEPIPVPEGVHTVLAGAVDVAGLPSPPSATAVRFDGTAPSSNASFAATHHAPPATYGQDLVVSLRAEDPGPTTGASGVERIEFGLDGAAMQRYTTPFRVTAPGDHTLRFRAFDLAGNIEDTNEVNFTIILVPGTFGFTINDGGKYTRESLVLLTPAPSTGPYEARFSNDDGRTFGPWTPVAPAIPWTLSAENGAKRLLGELRLAGGSVLASGTATITYMRESANLKALEGQAGESGWWISPVILHFEGNGSAEASTYFRVSDLRVSGDNGSTFPERILYLDEMEAGSTSWTTAAGVTGTFIPGTSPQGLGPLAFAYTQSPTAGARTATRIFNPPAAMSAYDSIGFWVKFTRSVQGQDQGFDGETIQLRVTLNGNIDFDRTIPGGVWTPVFLNAGIPASLSSLRLTFLQGSEDLDPLERESWAVDGIQAMNRSRIRDSVEGRSVWIAAATDTHAPTRTGLSDPVLLLLDWTPPVTNASVQGAKGNESWHVEAPLVSLVALDVPGPGADEASGVQRTTYEVDDGPTIVYTGPFRVSQGDGYHNVTFRSRDVAGNVESDGRILLKVDREQARTNVTLDPPRPSGREGWYVGPVRADFRVHDNMSGVARLVVRIDGVVNLSLEANRTLDFEASLFLDADGRFDVDPSATDVAGNVENATRVTVRIDRSPPRTTAKIDAAACDGWYNKPARVVLDANDTWTGADEVSGVARTYFVLDGRAGIYVEPIEVLADGDHVLAYFSEDHAGNIEEIRVERFRIDTQPPKMLRTFHPREPDGRNGWWRSDVLLNITGVDLTSGMSNITYRINATARVVVPGDRVTIPLARDGLYTVGWFGTDRACLSSVPVLDVVPIDSTPPKANLTLTPLEPDGLAGWYTSIVRGIIEAEDPNMPNASGVARVHFWLNGAHTAVEGSRAGFTVLGAGTFEVVYHAEDRAGNRGANRTATFRVDRNPPTLEFSVTGTFGNAGWMRGPTTARLDASDGASGVDRIEFTVDGGAPGVGLGAGSFLRVNVPLVVDGVHDIRWNATDEAGNRAANRTDRVRIDSIAPVTNATLDPAGPNGNASWYRSAVNVTLTASDPRGLGVDWTSNVSFIRYRLDSGPEQAYTGKFQVATDGLHTVTFYAQDVAGNREVEKSIAFKIDTQAPFLSCRANPRDGVDRDLDERTNPSLCYSRWYNGISIRVELNASDNMSGPREVAWRWYKAGTTPPGFTVDTATLLDVYVGLDASADANWTVEFFAVDVAGNRQAPVSFEVWQDHQAPRVFDETPRNNTATADLFAAVGAQYSDHESPNPSGVALDRYFLFVDGVNLTSAAQERTTERIRYTPSAPWACGAHEAVVWVWDNAGNLNDVQKWFFDVLCPATASEGAGALASPRIPLDGFACGPRQGADAHCGGEFASSEDAIPEPMIVFDGPDIHVEPFASEQRLGSGTLTVYACPDGEAPQAGSCPDGSTAIFPEDRASLVVCLGVVADSRLRAEGKQRIVACDGNGPDETSVAYGTGGPASGSIAIALVEGDADGELVAVAERGDATGSRTAIAVEGTSRGGLVAATPGLGTAESDGAAVGADGATGGLVAVSPFGDARATVIAVSVFGSADAPIAVDLP